MISNAFEYVIHDNWYTLFTGQYAIFPHIASVMDIIKNMYDSVSAVSLTAQYTLA